MYSTNMAGEMDSSSCGPGDKCWSGAQGKINKGKPMFSFKRKAKAKPSDDDGDEVTKDAGMHQNMRDLGSASGQVKLKPKNNKTALTPGQEAEGAANDRGVAKVKALMFKKKLQKSGYNDL